MGGRDTIRPACFLEGWNDDWRTRPPRTWSRCFVGMALPIRLAMVTEAYLDMRTLSQLATCRRNFWEALRRVALRRRFTLPPALLQGKVKRRKAG